MYLLFVSAVQYLGCYEDQRERDLGSAWLRFDEDNSIEKCAQECSKRGKYILHYEILQTYHTCTM